MMTPDPIFIGGLMKSGTTLLRGLVANHPDVFAGLETHWFSPEFADGWRDPTSQPIYRLLRFYDLSEPEYLSIRNVSATAYELVDRVLQHCARRAGRRRWAEKSPGNIAHVALIRHQWPQAVLLHVIRDPRDVYASWKRNAKYDLARFLTDARAIETATEGLLGTRTLTYAEIHYRDLVDRTRETMQDVITAIGERWVDGIESHRPDRAEFDRVKEVTGKESATLRSIGQPIFADSIGQWRTVLERDEVAAIERALADYGRRTGAFADE